MAPAPGRPVRCAMTKWGDRPHWTFDAVMLGSDEHGDWVGVPPGTLFTRPGHSFTGPNAQVVLVPRPAHPDDPAAWAVATFHGPGAGPLPPTNGVPVALYVDVATPATWDGDTLRSVDLDLDVLADVEGRVVVDDEDEFDEHRVRFGYPAEVVEAARAGCAAVLAAVRAGRAPYDGSHRRWLDAVTSSDGP